MTTLFGLMLLISLLSIGRDSRILVPHGLCAGACVAVMGHGTCAFTALMLLLTLNTGAWFVLRRFTTGHPENGAGALRTGIAVGGTMGLVLLAILSATPGLPVLICIAITLAGLCSASLTTPLLQFVGFLCALNGLLLLGGGTGNWMLLAATCAVWAGLAALGFWLLPRLAWLRTETSGDA